MGRLWSRGRRWMRRLVKAVAVLAVLLILAVGAAVGFVHTDRGRAMVKGQLETQLSKQVRGTIHIGRLEGSLLTGPSLVDVVVRDEANARVAGVERISVDYSLWSLVRKRVRIRRVRLVRPWAQARELADGTLNLARLVPESPPAKTNPGAPKAGAARSWRIWVGAVEVLEGRAALTDRRGAVQHVDNVTLRVGGVRVAGGRISTERLELSGQHRERGIVVQASGAAVLAGTTVTGELTARVRHGADITSVDTRPLSPERAQLGGASEIRISEVSFDSESLTGRANVSVSLRASTARLHPLLHEKQWAGDVMLRGAVTRRSASTPVVVDLRGTVADAAVQVDATANLATRHAGLTVVVDSLAFEKLSPVTPPGSASLKLVADVSGQSLAALTGTLVLTAQGRFRDTEISAVKVNVRAKAGEAVVKASADSSHGTVRASVVGLLARSPVAFKDLNVRGDVRQIAGLMPPESRARGRVTVVVKGSGTAERVNVQGAVTVSGGRFQAVTVPRARTTFSVKGPVSGPHVRLALRAQRVRNGAERIDGVVVTAHTTDMGKTVFVAARVGGDAAAYHLDTRARVDLAVPGRALVVVDRLKGRYRGLSIRALRGASVALGEHGQVTVRGLKVRSGAGALSVEGSLHNGLRIHSRRFEVATLARRLRLPPPYPQGVVTLDALVRKRAGTITGRVGGTMSGLALAVGRPVVGGSFSAELRPRRATVALELAGPQVGSVTVSASAITPRDVTGVRAWRRMQTRALDTADIRMTGLDVAGWSAFAGKPSGARGRLTGRIRLGAGGTSGTGKLRAVGVGGRDSVELVDADVSLEVASGRLRISSWVDAKSVGMVRAKAEAHVPLRLLDAAAWAGVNTRAVEGASIEVVSIDVGRLQRIVPTLPRMRGRIAATIHVAKHAASATVLVTGRKLRAVRSGAHAVDTTVRLSVGATRTTASVDARVGGARVVSGTATVTAGMTAALAGGAAALRRARVNGRLTIAGLPLRVVADELALKERRRMSGKLKATASVAGTLLAPTAKARIDLAGAKFGKIEFSGLEVNGAVDARGVIAKVVASQQRGGRLEITANARRSATWTSDVAVNAKHFDLAFLSSLDRTGSGPLAGIKGLADANLTMSGTPATMRPQGWVKLSRGALRVDGALPLHDIGVDVRIKGAKLTAKFAAKSGGGTLGASATGTLMGTTLGRVTARIKTSRFPLVAGQQKLTIDSSTRVSARRRGALWTVDAVLERGLVVLPTLSKQRSLHPTKSLTDVVFVGQRKRARRRARTSTLAATNTEPTLRLRVRVPASLRVRSEVAQATVAANLEITLVGGDVVVDGDAKTTRGRVDLLERRYKIRTAEVAFDGSVPPNPRLKVELAHAFDAMTLYVGVAGTATAPELTFRSDPGGYDRATLLAIFLGRDPNEASTEDVPIGDRAVELASGLLMEQVQSALKDVLPIDVLKVEVDDMASQRPSRVTVGKWVSSDLFVAYRYSPTADEVNNTNEAQLEYRLSTRWSLEGTYGDRGKGGVDILWIRRY